MSEEKPRLVVVPSDPIAAYEKAGIDWLEPYYNPRRMFSEVVVLSPHEPGDRAAHGLTIRHVKERHFADAVREIRPRLIRAYGGHWPARLCCGRRPGEIPVVVSVHDRRYELLDRAVRYADRVFCVSEAVEAIVRRRGTPADRVRSLPNRVDRSRFRPITDAAALSEVARQFPPGKHILQVGRKSPEKNLETILGALGHLPPDYSAVFVGQGDAAPYIALAERLGVASRCCWIPAVANQELPVWYSWCDCMCAPSLFEGFGIVFIEAAACGAAVVTSDAAPMNTYLRHGESAHLVADYQSDRAMAAAILAVCEDEAYAARLSAGAVKATERFAWDAVEAAEADLYREALDLPPHQATAEERLWRTAVAAAPVVSLPVRALRRAARTVVRSAASRG